MRQASIYYHFSNKQEILAELLADTVRPSMDYSTALAESGEPGLVQIHALTRFDVTLLARSRWNIGALYSMPELLAPEFAPFRAERATLRKAYGDRIASACAEGVVAVEDESVAAELVFALAESVISMRAAGRTPPTGLPDLVAAAVLRTLGCREPLLDEVQARSWEVFGRDVA